MKIIPTAYKEILNFSGTSNRSDFIHYVLSVVVTLFLASIVSMVLATFSENLSYFFTYTFLMFFVILNLIVSTSVSIRRLHDTGKSGWWFLLSLFPLVCFGLIIYLMLAKSQNFEINNLEDDH